MTEYAATYIAANQLSVDDDKTAFFHVTERIRAVCNGSNVYSSIEAVEFGDGKTTITLVQSVLTDPCDVVEPGGIWAGPAGNVPVITHEDDNTGGTGVKGGPALYEWDDTSIRFKNPDGSWGEWVDLGGSMLYTGYGAPSPELGVDGNYYFDLGEDVS